MSAMSATCPVCGGLFQPEEGASEASGCSARCAAILKRSDALPGPWGRSVGARNVDRLPSDEMFRWLAQAWRSRFSDKNADLMRKLKLSPETGRQMISQWTSGAKSVPRWVLLALCHDLELAMVTTSYDVRLIPIKSTNKITPVFHARAEEE